MVVDILQVCCAFQKMIYPYVSIRAMVKTWHTGKPWSSTILKGNPSAIPQCGYIIQSLIMAHMDDMPISSQIYIDLLYLSILIIGCPCPCQTLVLPLKTRHFKIVSPLLNVASSTTHQTQIC